MIFSSDQIMLFIVSDVGAKQPLSFTKPIKPAYRWLYWFSERLIYAPPQAASKRNFFYQNLTPIVG